jgi:hypothetical protein
MATASSMYCQSSVPCVPAGIASHSSAWVWPRYAHICNTLRVTVVLVSYALKAGHYPPAMAPALLYIFALPPGEII